MAQFYLDSSGLVKRYTTEVGSGWVRNLADPQSGNDLFTVRLTAVESTSAIVRQTPAPAPAILASVLTDLRADIQNQYHLVEATSSLIDSAMSLVEKHRLRGYDAVQLAAALQVHGEMAVLGLPALVFVSSDTKLNAAAQLEGLAVDDPNAHP